MPMSVLQRRPFLRIMGSAQAILMIVTKRKKRVMES